jgi:hypothetical protein
MCAPFVLSCVLCAARSFSTALLSRERAIVINLEHVKARAQRACSYRRALTAAL